jgi:glycine hydroxymethyltransferase
MNSIQLLTENETNRQSNCLNLIASENHPSHKVLKLLSAPWSNKYGEGYPGKRYYAGNEFTDQLESEVQRLALEVFDASDRYGVNVQVLSGSPANTMVYLGILNYGDTILSLSLKDGGHLSHLHNTSNWNKFFKHCSYSLKETTKDCFELDINNFKSQILANKPKLVIIGFSSYPRRYDFKEMIRFAHEHGAVVLADVAHINGLIAAGEHPSPFVGEDIETADFVSMTTHKTFRGQRGALLYAKNSIPSYISDPSIIKEKSLISIINKTIFPGTSGGPHFNVISAIGQACIEILDKENFKIYINNVLENTKLLEETLNKEGLKVISPTQTHMCLIQLPNNLDSLEVQLRLEAIGIMTNRNMLPNDTKTAFRPSGLRLGMAALTSQKIKPEDVIKLGKLLASIIKSTISEDEAKFISSQIIKNLKF